MALCTCGSRVRRHQSLEQSRCRNDRNSGVTLAKWLYEGIENLRINYADVVQRGMEVMVSAPRNFYRATNPQRVFDKLLECRKRWDEMAQFERSGQTEQFLHSLSAFLECFRTTANRLYGVVETQSGYQTMKALESQLNSHPQIGYLIDRAISESHGDGPVIWKRYNIVISETMQKYPPRLSPRFGDATRWVRFRSRFEPTTVQTQTVGTDWQFAGNSASLVELCRIALDE
jgi:hypothetical protein